MLRQYMEIKKQYPGTLLFFRLGDFYELFDEDAVVGARELQIALTARHKDTKRPIPMCGVPHHAAASYIARLVKKGFRVAVCEQKETPANGKKLVRREVVRVITPGTAIDPQLVESGESVYLASVSGTGEIFGAAFLELSTGEFSALEFTGSDAWSKIIFELESFSPRELLFPESLRPLVEKTFGNPATDSASPSQDIISIRPPESTRKKNFSLTPLDDWLFQAEDCKNVLKAHFNVRELSGYGLKDKSEAVRSAAACLRYAKETQRTDAEHISDINILESSEFMVLDGVTLRNLEIVETLGENAKRTLLGVIDQTVTAMGARLLRSWLLRPSVKRAEIQTRLSAVQEICNPALLDKLRVLLTEVSDLERLCGRLSLGTITPRDLLGLNKSIEKIPQINSALSDAESLLLQVLSENIFELPELQDLITRSIAENPPSKLSEGAVIREGFSAELDELRRISGSSKQTIAAFEEHERRRTGINGLRVKFNQVFGYCIEISKGSLSRVPVDYQRRQTLTNAERFTTPQLKEWEEKILTAEDSIRELETALFGQIKSEVAKKIKDLQSTARALATLDSLQSLAKTAADRNYVCPILHDGDEIEIKEGRHPVVETFSETAFIPNDLLLNNSTARLLIITGPNMGGKSTVMRQAALIQILAQIGSFVPARQARLPVIDRIWTRVGAADDLSAGRSTFMVEMTETAAILHNATPKSLVILDEIGRGTSTFDGLAIAWAVAEYIHNSPQHSAKTLFATHYHELTELGEKLPGARNFQITASEKDGDIVFLHKLQPGKASQSYGIAVARLAGLPRPVIARAREVLAILERYELAIFFTEKNKSANNSGALETAASRASKTKIAGQISLFALANEDVVEELRKLEIENFSAEEAKRILTDLQKRIV